MNKNFLFLSLFIWLGLLSTDLVRASPTLESTWLTFSSNGRYVFVVRSWRNLDEFRNAAIKSWQDAKISQREIRKLEESLADQIKKETEVRSRFPVSGLYQVGGDAAPVFSVSEWPNEIDVVLVPDDGRYVVGISRFINVSKIDGNTSSEDLLARDELGGIVFRADSAESCRVSLRNMVGHQTKFVITSDGFFWLEEKLMLLPDEGLIKGLRTDGTRFEMRVSDCSVLASTKEAPVSGSASKGDSCFAVFALVAYSLTLGGHILRP